MEEKEQKILDFMKNEDYIPMKAKEIAMLMRVPKNDYNNFLEIIGKLELELNCNKEVNIDLSKITELLIILLDNAIKYTKEGENIKVITHCKDGKATIEVADEGIGISDEQKKHLFERFYRADKARTRETGGTGLGLAIAQTIVKAHGGTIKVYNNTPKGTKFVVKI